MLLLTTYTCKYTQNRSLSNLAMVLPQWVTNYRPKPTGRERKNVGVVYNVSHFSFVSSTLNNSVLQLEFPNACVGFLGGSLCVIVGRSFFLFCVFTQGPPSIIVFFLYEFLHCFVFLLFTAVNESLSSHSYCFKVTADKYLLLFIMWVPQLIRSR